MDKNYKLYLNKLGLTGEEQEIVIDYIKELFEISILTLNNKKNKEEYDKF